MEKEKEREISTGRKFLFLAIIFFVFLLLIEGLLSMYYYQRSGGEKLASLEAIKSIKKIFASEKNELVYEPWVEYRHKNFESEDVQTTGLVRRSLPSFYQGAPGDTLDIYFFGGSTMFGGNVTDSETIPSQFVELYKAKFPRAKSVRVFNYGSSNYYSYQELMLLTDLIQKGHRPDALVFLDGINDFRFGNASYYRQSYFSYIFRQFFDSGLRSTGNFKFIDTADALCKNPDYIPADKFNSGLIDNYVSNIRNMQMLADMINAKAYFFCQPSPYYKYAGQAKQRCLKDTESRFKHIYPLLEKMQDSLPNFVFLGNMPAEEKGTPFNDSLHYSPLFNKKITEKIVERMEKDITL